MKKIILIGRSGCGKTTLTQALRGEKIQYHKTQYTNYYDVIIDTPGEYAENKVLASALALYAYEADVVGLLISAVEPYSLFSPNITCLVNRDVIGIVTQIDRPEANIERAGAWLELAGCRRVFYVSAYTGGGVGEIVDYLKEAGDILPWEEPPSEEEQPSIETLSPVEEQPSMETLSPVEVRPPMEREISKESSSITPPSLS